MQLFEKKSLFLKFTVLFNSETKVPSTEPCFDSLPEILNSKAKDLIYIQNRRLNYFKRFKGLMF